MLSMAIFLRRSKFKLYLDPRKTKSAITFTLKRLIMASCSRFEKIFDDLQTNPYFKKYANKISKLQQTNPVEFLQRIEEKERIIKKKKEHQTLDKQFEVTQLVKPKFDSELQTKKDKLNNIMKMDLIENKNKEEIKDIWFEYHKQKDCISGVLTKEQFKKIFERSKKYNTFILPLPRDHGYEFIMTQFYGNKIHMTPLLWYQVHKENAPECLTMIHYTELMETKDIVLMNGNFDIKSLTAQEAQCLANELQMYYSSDNPHRLKLLQTFTEDPNNFKHMDLITNLETISFDYSASDSSLSKK